jgi:hypothetical protein
VISFTPQPLLVQEFCGKENLFLLLGIEHQIVTLKIYIWCVDAEWTEMVLDTNQLLEYVNKKEKAGRKRRKG